MTLLLLVLFVACLAGSIAYSLESASTTGHGIVRGFAVGVIVWTGMAILVLLIRLMFTFA